MKNYVSVCDPSLKLVGARLMVPQPLVDRLHKAHKLVWMGEVWAAKEPGTGDMLIRTPGVFVERV